MISPDLRTEFQMRVQQRKSQFGIVPANQLITAEDRARQFSIISKHIGNTPLERWQEGEANIWIKIESENPFSESHYDRASLAMVKTLEERKVVKPGDKFLEGTSGSAGRSIGAICEMLGYELDIIVPFMDPDDPSNSDFPEERARDIRAFGANVISADEKGGIQKVQSKWKREVAKLRALARRGVGIYEELDVEGKPVIIYRDGYQTICAPNHSEIIITPNAFGNIAREVMDQLPQGEMIDLFIGTLGNGATLKGIRDILSEQNPDIKVIGTETSSAPTNAIRKIKYEMIQSGEYRQEHFNPKNPDPKAIAKLMFVFESRYGYKMPSKEEQTYHDSYGSSTPGYEPPFVEIDKIDDIVLVRDEWRDLQRRMNLYARLNNNPSHYIGNTSAENLYVALMGLKTGAIKAKNILVLFYDKGDQYANWPPVAKQYSYPLSQQQPQEVIPYRLQR